MSLIFVFGPHLRFEKLGTIQNNLFPFLLDTYNKLSQIFHKKRHNLFHYNH